MNEEKQIAPIDQVRKSLEAMSADFKSALPAQVTPEKFIRVAITAIRTSKEDLLKCDRHSLFAAIMLCAQDGLLPNGKEAVLQTYGNQVKYSPMVGGICKLARNSGEIKSIDAQVVYQNDSYEAWTDEQGSHFKHVRSREDRGHPVLTYAYAITTDGGFFFEEVDEKQMADIESMSKAKSGPWKGPFRDEMKRKSAIRRLAKYRLPSSTDLDEVIRRDDDMYDLAPQPNKAAQLNAMFLPKPVELVVSDAKLESFENSEPQELTQ